LAGQFQGQDFVAQKIKAQALYRWLAEIFSPGMRWLIFPP
jgi:hypothetical protein